jgi:AP-5 complex subunit zeta-1
MASPELAAGDGSYDFHLRSLSAASRDSAAAFDPASDPNLLQSVTASPFGPFSKSPCPVSWMSTRILRCAVSCAPFFFCVREKVRRVCEMCRTAKEAKDEMVARAFPVMGKLFQRCAAAPTQAVASTGVLLLVSRLFLNLALQRC